MKAVRYHKYGSFEELVYEEAPVPKVKENEVLIKVTATSFNPVDNMIQTGLFKEMFPISFPFIPNSDVAGVVEEIGTGVTKYKKGDKVFGFINLFKNGAAAEYVIAESSDLALAPESIDLASAAAVPAVSLTAWQGLYDHANLQPGSRVLITAVSGGVGTFAVQFAKLKGAYVIGTASEASKDIQQELGIDEVINYKTQKVNDAINEKVDVVFNLSPSGSDEINKLLDVIKPGGVLVSASAPADENLAKSKGITSIRMVVARNGEQLKQIAALIDEGKIKPIITESYPLKDLVLVHKKSAEGKIKGKVVITI